MLASVLLPDRVCKTCTAQQKLIRGCEQDARIPLRFDGEDMKRCPMAPMRENPQRFSAVFQLYRSYMKGYLPDPGSLPDQAYRFSVLMSVIEAAVEEAEQSKSQKEKGQPPRG